jgi:hypothetical protein
MYTIPKVAVYYLICVIAIINMRNWVIQCSAYARNPDSTYVWLTDCELHMLVYTTARCCLIDACNYSYIENGAFVRLH